MNLQGKDIIIQKNDGTTLAASKSCDLEMSCDTIETASITSGTFREFIAGRTSWTITTSWLVTELSSPAALLGTKLRIKIINTTDSGDYLVGNAICTKCKITATKGNLAQGSFAFQGTGPLE